MLEVWLLCFTHFLGNPVYCSERYLSRPACEARAQELDRKKPPSWYHFCTKETREL